MPVILDMLKVFVPAIPPSVSAKVADNTLIEVNPVDTTARLGIL